MTTRSSAPRRISIPSTVTVRQLSDMTSVEPVDIIKQLMRNGVMATVNQVIDFETAAMAATDLGFAVVAQEAPPMSPPAPPSLNSRRRTPHSSSPNPLS